MLYTVINDALLYLTCRHKVNLFIVNNYITRNNTLIYNNCIL